MTYATFITLYDGFWRNKKNSWNNLKYEILKNANQTRQAGTTHNMNLRAHCSFLNQSISPNTRPQRNNTNARNVPVLIVLSCLIGGIFQSD